MRVLDLESIRIKLASPEEKLVTKNPQNAEVLEIPRNVGFSACHLV